MNKEIEVKKRGWVKNAAIVFLAVMLVLTFFSNDIMNRSLPEVAAQYTQSGTINARIRSSGIVTANEIFEVITNQVHTVNEVRVRLDDFVETGDVLVTLAGSGSDELEAAEEELHAAELELEIFLVTDSPDNSFASFNRRIQVAQFDLDDARHKRNQAKDVRDGAKNRRNAARDELEQAVYDFEILDYYDEAAYMRMIEAQESLAQAEAELVQADEAFTATEKGVILAEQSLTEAQEALDNAKKSSSRETSLFNINVREKNRRIDRLREKISTLKEEGAVSEIKSSVSGRVKQINITSGNKTEPGRPIMVIEVVDRGYTLSVPVTAVQSSRVNVGDNAEVDRGWWSWGNPLSAVLTGIRPDPQNPASSRLLVFDVSGDDVESGMNLNITISQRSENYGIVVPNSAVRSDSNGDFVLLVETRSSPLRNRYIARRVDITILATDDTNSAISGSGLGGWDFIITTSTRPIEPGMQVRLVDNP